MRLLYITDCFPRCSEVFIAREIAALEARGAQVQVLSLSRPAADEPEQAITRRLQSECRYLPDYDRDQITKLRCHLTSLWRNPRCYLRALSRHHTRKLPNMHYLMASLPLVAEAIAGFGPQHLHAHFGRMGLLMTWLTSGLLERPFSVTLHGSDVLVCPYPALGIVLRDAARVLCVSEAIRQRVVSTYGVSPQRAVHLPNGVDTALFRPAAPPDGPLRLLTVARLHPVKGLADLVAACALLRQQEKEFTWTLVGAGSEREQLETRVRDAGLTDVVTFAGAVDNEALPELYRRHHVFVLSSHSEGLPVVVLEAMASGLPVVATHVGGVPELVEPGVNGLLVPPRQPEQLAEALAAIWALPPEARGEMGQAGRERAEQRYGAKIRGERQWQLFAGMLQDACDA